MTMLIRRLHKLPFLCLLVLSLLTSPASSLGYVWCLSADGHAALEAAMAGDCGMDNPAPIPVDTPDPALTVEDDCGPCLDVSTSHQWGSPRSRQEETAVSIPAEFAPVAMAEYPSLPDPVLNRPAVDAIPRTPDPILHHRTIVLLI
ncbi:MAG: hypothetical protein NDI73_04430 [Desulfuromonadales bacterium]|nr:hypothetical protein [Desulfuromonadales bacterium]